MAAVTTQKAITANPIHNNGGTLLFGNTSEAVTNIMGKNGIARKRIIPTTPKVRSNRITTVLGSGNFAYMGAGEYQFMNYINGKINGTAQSFPYVRGRRGKVYSVNSSTGRKVSYLALSITSCKSLIASLASLIELIDLVTPFISISKDNFSIFYRDWETDRKSTRLNSSHSAKSRMPSSA